MLRIRLTKKNEKETLDSALNVLKNGGIVIFPSDTVYGLLVDAKNQKAVNKLIKFKNRPPGKAISVFVSDFKMLKKEVVLTNKQEEILKEILPGSYTVILKSRHKLSRQLESENNSLGIRYVKYPLINKLIEKLGNPATATSANLNHQSPHYSINSLLSNLTKKKLNKIDLIVDAGILPRNKPSTVIDLSEPKIKILRQGNESFLNIKKYISNSPNETKKIARLIFEKIKTDDKPLIFIIEGELGSGKTVFVKGIGEKLGINNIVSPTYVIYYEYEIKKLKVKNQYSKFVHLDLYNIQENNEFKYLTIEKLLKPENILAFEWGEKAGEIYEMLKSKGKIINVKIKYINEKTREIITKI